MAAAKNIVQSLLIAAGCGAAFFAGPIQPVAAASVPIVETPKDTEEEPKPKKKGAPPPTYVRNYTMPEQPATTVTKTTPAGSGTATTSTTATSSTTSATTSTTEANGSTGEQEKTAESAPASSDKTSDKTATSTQPEKPINPAIMPYLTAAYGKMREGNFSSAVNTLCEAVRADAGSVAARRYLAYALLRVNEPLDAIQQLGLITKMTKPTTFDLYSLGEAYYTLGDYRQALENYNNALASNETYDAARGGSIKALAMMGKYDEAAKLCVEGLAKTRDTKAQTYYRQLYNLIAEEKAAPQQQVIFSDTTYNTRTEYSYSPSQWKSVSTPEIPNPAQQEENAPGVAPIVTPGVAPVVRPPG